MVRLSKAHHTASSYPPSISRLRQHNMMGWCTNTAACLSLSSALDSQTPTQMPCHPQTPLSVYFE